MPWVYGLVLSCHRSSPHILTEKTDWHSHLLLTNTWPPLLDGTAPEPVTECYKVFGYADDVKPAVSSMHEFALVDKAASLFERNSGCMLHRDPATGKCKVLPLGRWRNTLQQEDIRHGTVPELKVPPYYSGYFFNIIMELVENSPLNPVYMSVKQWYSYILEIKVTMEKFDDEGRMKARL